jgi:glutathione S-transferase
MAGKYTLCSFDTCPWVQRAAIVLQQKGVPYDINYIDPDNRPEWFLKISPHAKVPVLQVDEKHSLFESNAIAEFLDETAEPRLHPEDPLERARNRAWTDYVTTFSIGVTKALYADTEEDFNARLERIPGVFQKLEDALALRGNEGPYFNGRKFSLVDAAYAPFLQRYTFLDRLKPVGIIEKYPRLKAWRDALLATPAVKASTIPGIEQAWRQNLVRRKRWLGKFVEEKAAA